MTPSPSPRARASRWTWLTLAAGLGLAGLGLAALAMGAGGIMPRPAPLLSQPATPEMAAEPVLFADGHRLEVMRFEVTRAEWQSCVEAGACAPILPAGPVAGSGVGAGADPQQIPATGINFLDALAYLDWLNAATDGGYRLPTLAEWQEMARPVLPEAADPIFTDPNLRWASAYLLETAAPRRLQPKGSFAVTAEGIADLDGSVWEWTSDCVQGPEVPADRCAAFYVGGLHVAALSYLVRDPARGGCAGGAPPAHLGLRLVRALPPRPEPAR